MWNLTGNTGREQDVPALDLLGTVGERKEDADFSVPEGGLRTPGTETQTRGKGNCIRRSFGFFHFPMLLRHPLSHAKRRRVSEADEGEVQIKAAHGADEHFSSTTTKEETTSTVQSQVDKSKKPEVKELRDKDDDGTQLKFKKPATGTLSDAKRLEMKRKKADTKKLSFSVDDDE